jgi:hypothetical protein
MANALEKEMFDYFTQLNKTEKKTVVRMLKSFLRSRKDNPGRISIEQYNKELEEAMEEMKVGEVYSHDEVVKMAKDW